ncbi:MAG: hypothetical protein ACJ8DI_07765 [Ktedonobacteraceae bacterium]
MFVSMSSGQSISGRGRATTRAHPPHPLPAIPVPQTGFPYYRTIPVAPCIVGIGAFVAARPVAILHPSPYLNGIGRLQGSIPFK